MEEQYLKRILSKEGVRMWTGFVWHRVGTSGRVLWAR